jgi:putative PEP-CTERM system TPR-repeat lipoprotein
VAALKLTGEVLIDYPRHYRATMLKGDILSSQGDRAGAEAAYREASSVIPTSIQPRLNLIGLLVRSKEIEKATTEVDALTKIAPRDPRTAYAKALVLVVQKKFPDAKASILQVLRVAPDHTPTLLLAGIVAYELGAYSEAEGHLRKVVDQAPDALFPKRLLTATRLQNGQVTRAVSDVQALLRRAPDDPDVLALAGEAYLANGDVVRAAHYYERVNSVKPDNTAARTRLGQIRFAAGDTDRAVQDLEAASAGNSSPSQADFSLVTIFLRQKEFDKALAAVLALEKKRPDNPITQYLKGMVYLAKRDLKSARSSFERAVAIYPDYLPPLINLARLDLHDNNAEAARKRFETILKKEPNNEQALLANATLLRAIGAPTEEITKQLQKAVSANPSAPAPRLALINHYLLARDTKAAMSAAQSARAALPDNPSILEATGTVQLVAGENLPAVSTFAKLARLTPNAAEPLVKQAAAQMAAGDADSAIESLRKALALKPDLALVQQHITSIYVKSGRVKDAIHEARDLQHKQPKNPLGFILEGDIYIQQRDWASAEKIYRAARQDFDIPPIAVRLIAVLEATGKPEEASKIGEKWVAAHPDDISVLVFIADRDLAAKHFDSAATRYRSALEKKPDNPLVLNNLAWTLHQLKDPSAQEYAQRALDLVPDNPAIMDTLGVILVETGKPERGLELLSRAIELAPDAHQIRLNLAKAMIAANRKDAARKELEALVKLDARLRIQKEASSLLEKM